MAEVGKWRGNSGNGFLKPFPCGKGSIDSFPYLPAETNTKCQKHKLTNPNQNYFITHIDTTPAYGTVLVSFLVEYYALTDGEILFQRNFIYRWRGNVEMYPYM